MPPRLVGRSPTKALFPHASRLAGRRGSVSSRGLWLDTRRAPTSYPLQAWGKRARRCDNPCDNHDNLCDNLCDNLTPLIL